MNDALCPDASYNPNRRRARGGARTGAIEARKISSVASVDLKKTQRETLSEGWWERGGQLARSFF